MDTVLQIKVLPGPKMSGYKIALSAGAMAIALLGWLLTAAVQKVRLAAQRTDAI